MKSLVKLILEADQKFKYGCVMLYFKFPELKNLQKKIDKEDIYTEEGDRTYGLEDEPHVTLLFVLHEEVTLDDVKPILDKVVFSDLILYKPSLFENEKYDVLKFDVTYPTKGGAFLSKINKELRKFPHTNDYPDYHPHMTIGYLKPGTGKKYTKLFKDEEYQLTPSYAVYSVPSGEKHKIKIQVQ